MSSPDVDMSLTVLDFNSYPFAKYSNCSRIADHDIMVADVDVNLK